jgi:hypothetical protein
MLSLMVLPCLHEDLADGEMENIGEWLKWLYKVGCYDSGVNDALSK